MNRRELLKLLGIGAAGTVVGLSPLMPLAQFAPPPLPKPGLLLVYNGKVFSISRCTLTPSAIKWGEDHHYDPRTKTCITYYDVECERVDLHGMVKEVIANQISAVKHNMFEEFI